MKRLAFTIVLNGEKHLLHNNYAEYLLDKCLDYWVVVEGATKSGGSTSWCTGDISKYHKDGHSIDRTLEILENLQKKYPNKLQIITKNQLWNSKDEMVNVAIQGLKDNGFNEGWLYQIDIDEQWLLEDMIENETFMLENNIIHGDCKFYQYVGSDIYAEGPNWGGNSMHRIWNWVGEYFNSHEPPSLNKIGKIELLPKKYKHYSYVYEEDVMFKSDWYGYGEDFFQRWKKLQIQIEFPRNLKELHPNWMGENGIIKKL